MDYINNIDVMCIIIYIIIHYSSHTNHEMGNVVLKVEYHEVKVRDTLLPYTLK